MQALCKGLQITAQSENRVVKSQVLDGLLNLCISNLAMNTGLSRKAGRALRVECPISPPAFEFESCHTKCQACTPGLGQDPIGQQCSCSRVPGSGKLQRASSHERQ